MLGSDVQVLRFILGVLRSCARIVTPPQVSTVSYRNSHTQTNGQLDNGGRTSESGVSTHSGPIAGSGQTSVIGASEKPPNPVLMRKRRGKRFWTPVKMRGQSRPLPLPTALDTVQTDVKPQLQPDEVSQVESVAASMKSLPRPDVSMPPPTQKRGRPRKYQLASHAAQSGHARTSTQSATHPSTAEASGTVTSEQALSRFGGNLMFDGMLSELPPNLAHQQNDTVPEHLIQSSSVATASGFDGRWSSVGGSTGQAEASGNRQFPFPDPEVTPVKRGRGRPRKVIGANRPVGVKKPVLPTTDMPLERYILLRASRGVIVNNGAQEDAVMQPAVQSQVFPFPTVSSTPTHMDMDMGDARPSPMVALPEISRLEAAGLGVVRAATSPFSMNACVPVEQAVFYWK